MFWTFLVIAYLCIGIVIDASYHSSINEKQPRGFSWITFGWPIWLYLIAMLYAVVFVAMIYIKINLWWTLKK